MSEINRLLILTGPSCVGKSPLVKALSKLWPGQMEALLPLVLYNDRLPRPGEKDGVDYHFRSTKEIEETESSPDCVVVKVRSDTQALDVNELKNNLGQASVLYEGNPFVAEVLQTDPRLAGIPRRSVFLSPLSEDELADIKSGPDPDKVVTDVMRRKLLRRARHQKGDLSLKDLEDIERRASSAWREIHMAGSFDHVVINHDGEDHEHWSAFPVLIGDARKAVSDVKTCLLGD